ncbi:MAG: GNAT family N-acetyltransferase [Spirochaetales bacterium]|nr:MAG: GNAT family N-acetyltransferase [Spirochaetales bacterium]
MFDINEILRGEIIFAMENQEIDFGIDIDTGEVVARNDENNESAERERGEISEPPVWTSGDGFRLMESFARTVGDPEVMTALMAALSRGRGVFRAFKDTLARYTEIERRWFAYKDTVMGRRVDDWYDSLREASGLARLGPEPEETSELLAGEFEFRRAGGEAWPECRELFSRSLDEALGKFPEALVEYEYAVTDREISAMNANDLSVFMVEAAAGAMVAVAVARKIFIADRSFGKLIFLYVMPEQRDLGLGQTLSEHAREALAAEGVSRFIVDIPFLPEGFGLSLASFGYVAFGTRWLRTSD